MSGMSLASFVPVAKSCHFPIQNLPFGIFRPNAAASPRAGVAIGEFVLDVSAIAKAGLLQPSEHITDFSCFSKVRYRPSCSHNHRQCKIAKIASALESYRWRFLKYAERITLFVTAEMPHGRLRHTLERNIEPL